MKAQRHGSAAQPKRSIGSWARRFRVAHSIALLALAGLGPSCDSDGTSVLRTYGTGGEAWQGGEAGQGGEAADPGHSPERAGSAGQGGSVEGGQNGAGGVNPDGTAGQGSNAGFAAGSSNEPSAGGAGGAGGAGEPTPSRPSLWMRAYDPYRTNSNLSETLLRPALINGNSFGKLFCKPVDDEIYGQILYASDLAWDLGGARDVAYVVTMNDSVYAFDANDPSPEPLWHVNFTAPEAGVSPVPTADLSGPICPVYRDMSHQVGITSTPVIDPETQTLYVVARTKEPAGYVQRLHALDMLTGSERAGSPITLDAQTPGTGPDAVSGMLRFNARRNNQRAGLLLHDGLVYIAFASHCDAGPYHGWFLGYDARTLQQRVVYNTTPNGQSGGIWMSGAAPAVDAAGAIYLITGNGSANLTTPGPNRGQAFLKLVREQDQLRVIDWFTPSDYATIEREDRDLGSSGPVLIPESRILVSGNKQGSLYVLDSSDLGGYAEGQNDRIVQRVELVDQTHVHGTPGYWKSSAGSFVYVMAEEDHLKQFAVINRRLILYKSSSYSAPVDPFPASFTTMPGGILTISADASDLSTGLVWVTVPSRHDANHAVVPGVLRVFAAADVTQELWNSDSNFDRDSFGDFAKFNPPTVVNGKVYVPTFSGQFCVYGMLSPAVEANTERE